MDKKKKLQKAGIIVYTVIMISFILVFIASNIIDVYSIPVRNAEFISSFLLDIGLESLVYIVIMQSGIIYLVQNFKKNSKGSKILITVTTVVRLISIYPIILIAALENEKGGHVLPIFYLALIIIEAIVKPILAIYNLVVSNIKESKL